MIKNKRKIKKIQIQHKMKALLLTVVAIATLLTITGFVFNGKHASLESREIRYYDGCTNLELTTAGVFVDDTCSQAYKYTVIPLPTLKRSNFVSGCVPGYKYVLTDFTSFDQIQEVRRTPC
ncbi:transmembrane protein, putative (macronuclear) [Tetrahymena thermophila SB210]|uniref:Transmembrane protein, putative n=1 Tax=Tetrahymena thermophila (strain SB210) TaxID=312017 RepID=Q24D35_TETTS|nr:transmembrane protein, putative [Tetrahymena thermophila SB210]EAS05706.2 transmembrane protein, putative [Tetrahymena thermophila SB210]|eukprot:XP_001025951.2 transmembrane protein, putative [Tetrahymena thermophila SB210]